MPKVDQFESKKKIYCILSRGYKQNFAEITVNIAALDIGSVHKKKENKKNIQTKTPKKEGEICNWFSVASKITEWFTGYIVQIKCPL